VEELFGYVRVIDKILLNIFNIIIIIIILVGVGTRRKNITKGRKYNILSNVLYIYDVDIGNFVIYYITI